IRETLFFHTAGRTAADIIWKIRLPRIAAVVVLGGALALSGFLLQTFFHNPIAGPYVLGISSGAKLMVALTLIYFLGRMKTPGSFVLILAAFFGAMLSMGFVLFMAGYVRNIAMLIICGIMIGYIASSITDFVITFAAQEDIVNLHNWSLGSFSGMSWQNVGMMSLVVFMTLAAVFFMAKPMGAYQLGEEYAKSMGVNIKAFRVGLILISSLLSACVTAFAGPISFVGIAVPHLMKFFLKTARPMLLIPACFLGGSVFCMGCDLLARTLFAPTELNISSVTAVFGAPVVIVLLIKRGRSVHE
ncbi:MAG TPA: iron ABC transporter permease, partial [Lachnospiraceae bacterium]|nr:iron ABC transporter permease [Lachnospiraceae bacterium]